MPPRARNAPDPARAALAVQRWRDDPVAFATEVLGIEPWEDEEGYDSQATILRDVPRHRTMATRSGHKTGKSCSGGILAWWGYCLHPEARIIITAPTWRQVEEVIWREVVQIYARCRARGIDLGGQVYERPDKGVRGSQGRQIFGFSTDDPDRFSGISGPFVMYLVDEGSGVDDKIDEAIEGNRAGGAWKISFGNPTRTEGWFFRAFHEESDLYRTYHLSSERTPTARGVKDIPGLARPEWIEQRRKAWHPHETHPLYGIRVRGDFPAQAATAVISLALVQAARLRWTPTCPAPELGKRLEVGLDCARFGDDANALAPRRGRYVYPLASQQGMDSIQVAGWAKAEILKLRTHAEKSGLVKRPRVKVDVIGIGAGVYDQLRAIAPELEVVPVNSSEAPTGAEDEEQYTNVRSQMHFATAAWLTDGGMLPPDDELRAELLAPQYSFDVRGRQKVEKKDDIKARLGRSPDKGDALHLSIHDAKLWSPKPMRVADL